jgi:ribose transport system substrate-binding protein
MKKIVLCLAAGLLVVGLISCSKSGNKNEPKKLSIAVIPKGTTHEFWKSIHAGAVKAATELGVEIIWKGPHKEDDRSQQIVVVEDFITKKVDGMVLAPLDDKALVKPVEEAVDAKIPVVVIDSGLKTDKITSFVATDNYQGGVLGADRLAEILSKKGKIFVVKYQEGSESTMQREKGFTDTIKKKYPNIKIVAEQYGGATTEVSYRAAENLLNAHPNIDGIFCPNESTTFGALRALEDSGKAGKIKFVGFDSSKKLVEALSKKYIHGLVLQNPMRMGELGVRTIVAQLQGKPVEKRVDTGVFVATPENMNTPEMQELLNPDFDKYLK